MAIFKCKMCGGTLEIKAGETVATCEYCGTQQTLPRLDDERRAQMYDRANHFRRNNEFDKAGGVYEQILIEDNTDAEAYWSLVLCRYGIEYVEDPVSHKRIPTINRTQMTSVFGDENYKSALQYADINQKDIYEKEAKAIDEIQKGILEISQKEEPFDIFICYKETDTQGRRTPDSVLANDLYHQLTKEGYKVFFSRITLEDKLGTAYEPYIFAALNSAKVMIVLGTKGEYFNAVWVKNEWKRYLALIKGGEDKVLIPAYKDMDPYDLPEDFSYLQAQDMSKLGFMQDMLHGIGKFFAKKRDDQSKVLEIGTKSDVNALIKRMFIFLEDGNWEKADEYCERILDMDPENAEAYIGKVLIKYNVRQIEDLTTLVKKEICKDINFIRAMKFSSGELERKIQIIVEAERKEREKNIIKLLNDADEYRLKNSVDELQVYEEIIKQYPEDYRGWWKKIEYRTREFINNISITYLNNAIQLQLGEMEWLYDSVKASLNYRDDLELDKDYRKCIFQIANCIYDFLLVEKTKQIQEKEYGMSDLYRDKNYLSKKRGQVYSDYQHLIDEKVTIIKGNAILSFALSILIIFFMLPFGLPIHFIFAIWFVSYLIMRSFPFVINKLRMIDKIEENRVLNDKCEKELELIDSRIKDINDKISKKEKELEDFKLSLPQFDVNEINTFLLMYDENNINNTNNVHEKISVIEENAIFFQKEKEKRGGIISQMYGLNPEDLAKI